MILPAEERLEKMNGERRWRIKVEGSEIEIILVDQVDKVENNNKISLWFESENLIYSSLFLGNFTMFKFFQN